MFPATPYVRRELKHLCLRKAALDRLINSLEEYSLLAQCEQEEPSIRPLHRAEESVLTCPVQPWQAPKPHRIGKRA
jgi:hypothetical protein